MEHLLFLGVPILKHIRVPAAVFFLFLSDNQLVGQRKPLSLPLSLSAHKYGVSSTFITLFFHYVRDK